MLGLLAAQLKHRESQHYRCPPRPEMPRRTTDIFRDPDERAGQPGPREDPDEFDRCDKVSGAKDLRSTYLPNPERTRTANPRTANRSADQPETSIRRRTPRRDRAPEARSAVAVGRRCGLCKRAKMRTVQ